MRVFQLTKRDLAYFSFAFFVIASHFDRMDVLALLNMYGTCGSDAATAHEVQDQNKL